MPLHPYTEACSPPLWRWRATGIGLSLRRFCPARPIPRQAAPSTPGALPATERCKTEKPSCGSLKGAGSAPATWWKSAPAKSPWRTTKHWREMYENRSPFGHPCGHQPGLPRGPGVRPVYQRAGRPAGHHRRGTSARASRRTLDTLNTIEQLSGARVLFVPGNHDLWGPTLR